MMNWSFAFSAVILMLMVSVVSYNPNLIAFSTTGCNNMAGIFIWPITSEDSMVVVSRWPNRTFSMSRYKLKVLQFFCKSDPLILLFL